MVPVYVASNKPWTEWCRAQPIAGLFSVLVGTSALQCKCALVNPSACKQRSVVTSSQPDGVLRRWLPAKAACHHRLQPPKECLLPRLPDSH